MASEINALEHLISTRSAFIEARKIANEAILNATKKQKEWSMAKDELSAEDQELLAPITKNNQEV